MTSTANPRKLEHRFRRISARIPYHDTSNAPEAKGA